MPLRAVLRGLAFSSAGDYMKHFLGGIEAVVIRKESAP